MKRRYIKHEFRKETLSLIEKVNAIIDEYMTEGYELTLRQLFYQFVARDILANTERQYKRLGELVSNGRLAGLIDWSAIVDRTRKYESNSHWSNPEAIIEAAAETYAIDTRSTQKTYLEVWIEKQALVGILESACEPLDIPYFSCRGYVSQSAIWSAAERILEALDEQYHKKAIILYLGDHDPSGLDMGRDIQGRFDLFSGGQIELRRIALNEDQISQYKPPPNPAKVTDSRYEAYVAEYGINSWELDALDPRTIHQLITKTIKRLTNKIARKHLIEKQEEERSMLWRLANNFDPESQ